MKPLTSALISSVVAFAWILGASPAEAQQVRVTRRGGGRVQVNHTPRRVTVQHTPRRSPGVQVSGRGRVGGTWVTRAPRRSYGPSYHRGPGVHVRSPRGSVTVRPGRGVEVRTPIGRVSVQRDRYGFNRVRRSPRYVAPRYVAPRYVAPRYVAPRRVVVTRPAPAPRVIYVEREPAPVHRVTVVHRTPQPEPRRSEVRRSNVFVAQPYDAQPREVVVERRPSSSYSTYSAPVRRTRGRTVVTTRSERGPTAWSGSTSPSEPAASRPRYSHEVYGTVHEATPWRESDALDTGRRALPRSGVTSTGRSLEPRGSTETVRTVSPRGVVRSTGRTALPRALQPSTSSTLQGTAAAEARALLEALEGGSWARACRIAAWGERFPEDEVALTRAFFALLPSPGLLDGGQRAVSQDPSCRDVPGRAILLRILGSQPTAPRGLGR